MPKKRLMNVAVFCSGKGTNLQAIIDKVKSGYIKANLGLVICDKKDAYALVRAKRARVDTVYISSKAYKTRVEFEREILKHLKKYNIDMIVLAGFMRVLTASFVKRYKNKILNIHPALLPSFKGTDGIGDALKHGVKVAGVSVHFVDEGVDTGAIILQEAVKVKDNDTHDSLAKRIHEIEHVIYPRALKLVVEGKVKIVGRKTIVA